MIRIVERRGGIGAFWRPVVVAVVPLVALAFIVGVASTAFAHEGEKNVPGVTLVQEAIAIARSQPELMDSVADKIKDTLDANNQANVNIDLVRQAQAALDSGNMAQVELLLEQSIGACPGQPVIAPGGLRSPQPITSPCPKVSHLTALNRVPVRGTARPVLLSLAVMAIAGGLLLARRVR
jgi:hypothetical protein